MTGSTIDRRICNSPPAPKGFLLRSLGSPCFEMQRLRELKLLVTRADRSSASPARMCVQRPLKKTALSRAAQELVSLHDYISARHHYVGHACNLDSFKH
jgi:hypothetical protein